MLRQLRKQIDSLDRELLHLLNQRAGLVLQIGSIKKRLGLPIFDGKREREVLRRLVQSRRGPLPAVSARRIFREILRSSRAIQVSTSASKKRR